MSYWPLLVNIFDFESHALGLLFQPLLINDGDLKRIKLLFAEPFLEDDQYSRLIASFYIRILNEDIAALNQIRSICIKVASSYENSPPAFRSLGHLEKLIDYICDVGTEQDRDILLMRFMRVLIDRNQCAFNQRLLSETCRQRLSEESLFRYYNNQKLCRHRYCYPQDESYELFGLLAGVYTRSQWILNPSHDEYLSLDQVLHFRKDIIESVQQAIDRLFSFDVRSFPLYQVISPGRSGTYLLRSLILDNADSMAPIHSTFQSPSWSVKCVFFMSELFSQGALGENKLSLSSRQMQIMSSAMKSHLVLFCLELIACFLRFEKVPLIINHWWTPSALLLKEILPGLRFFH